MKNNNEELIYGKYRRKSSEDNRQVRSMEDQGRDIDGTVSREKLAVGVDYPDEAQSAFVPGRPIFERMMNDVQKGVINAIIVWHANRLSRNPIDTGRMIYLMDMGRLKQIKTMTRTYSNTPDDKFMLQLDCASSKKDSDDKSLVVKRALEGRALRGIPNGIAHIGYLNNKEKEKGNRDWHEDPIRFPLVELILRKMLKGCYSVRQIHRYAKDVLKLTTPVRGKEGGRPIAPSYMYTLLRNPVYAGFFFQRGKDKQSVRYTLDPKLKRIITEDEYWKIQAMLGKKGRPRPQQHEGLFNHFGYCGKCGGGLTPDYKFQVICSQCKFKFAYRNKEACPKCGIRIEKMENPKYLSYIYYTCSGTKKGRVKCLKASAEGEVLQNTLINYVDQNISISGELSRWCIDNIGQITDDRLQEMMALERAKERAETELKNKIDRMMDTRFSQENLSDEQVQWYNEKEKELRQKLKEAKELRQKEPVRSNWFEEAKKSFNLMSEILDILKNGTNTEKIEAMVSFGSNLAIKDKKASVINAKEVQLFVDSLHEARQKNNRFEPKKSLANKDKTEVFTSVCPTLLPLYNEIRTFFQQNPDVE
jgi:DNA invertase Pin-like site-specific DNA recombinase